MACCCGDDETGTGTTVAPCCEDVILPASLNLFIDDAGGCTAGLLDGYSNTLPYIPTTSPFTYGREESEAPVFSGITDEATGVWALQFDLGTYEGDTIHHYVLVEKCTSEVGECFGANGFQIRWDSFAGDPISGETHVYPDGSRVLRGGNPTEAAKSDCTCEPVYLRFFGSLSTFFSQLYDSDPFTFNCGSFGEPPPPEMEVTE